MFYAGDHLVAPIDRISGNGNAMIKLRGESWEGKQINLGKVERCSAGDLVEIEILEEGKYPNEARVLEIYNDIDSKYSKYIEIGVNNLEKEDYQQASEDFANAKRPPSRITTISNTDFEASVYSLICEIDSLIVSEKSRYALKRIVGGTFRSRKLHSLAQSELVIRQWKLERVNEETIRRLEHVLNAYKNTLSAACAQEISDHQKGLQYLEEAVEELRKIWSDESQEDEILKRKVEWPLWHTALRDLIKATASSNTKWKGDTNFSSQFPTEIKSEKKIDEKYPAIPKNQSCENEIVQSESDHREANSEPSTETGNREESKSNQSTKKKEVAEYGATTQPLADSDNPKQSLEKLRLQAEKESQKEITVKKTKTHKTQQYTRSKAVKQYAKARSDGICEGCGEPAPFENTQGDPYLHVHHVYELSDGGSDTPDTVIALCPNCHYEIHHGKNGNRYNRKLVEKLEEIENGL